MIASFKNKIFPFIAWLGVASYFIFGLGMTGLKEQKQRSLWPKYQAKIIDTIIESKTKQEGASQFGLHLKLLLNFNGQERVITRYKTSGTSDLKGFAKRQYPIGKTIELYINPKDPDEILFEVHHSWGPYLIGFLPGLFFVLIAISTLFYKEQKARD